MHVDGKYSYAMYPDTTHANPLFRDGNYTNGEAYKVDLGAKAFAASGVIDHFYYFSAFDGLDDGRCPSSGSISGPYFLAELNRYNVTPETGTTNTVFDFRVTYTDISGIAPDWVHVNIDGMIVGNMTPQDGAADTLATGEVYLFATKLAIGVHSYNFSAYTFKAELAVGAKPQSGPSVRQGPMADLSIPSEGISLSTSIIDKGTTLGITFKVLNSGLANVPPEDPVNVSVYQSDPDTLMTGALLLYTSVSSGAVFPKGASVSYTFSYTVPAGDCREYDLYFYVDRDAATIAGIGAVQEMIEYGPNTNNRLVYPLMAGPDLAISSVDPVCAQTNLETLFVVKVTNVGHADALIPAGGIPLFLRQQSGMALASAPLTPGAPGLYFDGVNYFLQPGKTTEIAIRYTFVNVGDKPLEVMIDSALGKGAIDEIIEYDDNSDGKADAHTNNRELFTISVITVGFGSPSFAPSICLLLFSLMAIGVIAAVNRR